MKILTKTKSALLALLAATSVTGAAAPKPNLLLIVTDEHNFRTIGSYRDQLSPEQAEVWGPGNVVETPYIDSLAKHGTLFDRMYASAPVCTPARAAMFTGMYGQQLGIPNNSNKPGDDKYLKPEVTTIAEVLQDAGYMTGYIGKWHLSEAREDHKAEWWQPYPVGHPGHNYGFKDNKFMFNGGHDKWYGIDADGNPYRAGKKPTQIGVDDAGQPVFKDAKSENVKYATDWLADRTLDFIDANKDQPFFCVVSIPDPHTPDIAREPYYSMYKDMDFKQPSTYNAPRTKDSPKWQKPDGKAKKMLESIPHYFGMVKCIDDNVGRILQKLESEGILENTIVVFTSDHGDLYGEHARMNKGTVHEASARIPFLIAHGRDAKSPLVPRGKVVKEAANTTDWMPTLLSLLGVDCPDVSGRDVTPLLADNPPADWNDVTFSQLGFIAAIDSRYKLYVSPWDEPWLLDIKTDPDELQNLINNPERASVARKLAKDLVNYQETFGSPNSKLTQKLNAIISK